MSDGINTPMSSESQRNPSEFKSQYNCSCCACQDCDYNGAELGEYTTVFVPEFDHEGEAIATPKEEAVAKPKEEAIAKPKEEAIAKPKEEILVNSIKNIKSFEKVCEKAKDNMKITEESHKSSLEGSPQRNGSISTESSMDLSTTSVSDNFSDDTESSSTEFEVVIQPINSPLRLLLRKRKQKTPSSLFEDEEIVKKNKTEQ